MSSSVGGTDELHWADWLVFVVYLIVITSVGVVVGVINRRQATTKDFLQAGSQMHFFLVTLSIQATFLSAIFVVSFPAESYNFGIAFVYLGFGYMVAFPLIGKLFLPIYFRLKVSSAYQYLEIRFNRVVRVAASLTFLLEMVLYLSVAIYTPALIIEQVSPIPVWGCILLVSGICTLYTVIGGMKATIWNDAIQMTVILVMLVLLIAFGHVNAGNLREVYQIAKNGSRLDFNVFVPQPTSRTTFWTQFIGGTFLNFAMFAASQTVIQKTMSARSLEDAQRSMNALAGTYITFLILTMWLGIVMYAYYAECDPQLAGYVDKADQLVPKFMMDILGSYHGLPGLFIAAIFSGALSTVSGGLNSMAGVCYVDFVSPLYYYIKTDEMSEKAASLLSRLFVLIWGGIVTAMAFVAPYMGDLILSIAQGIFGMVGGPICGVLATGIFLPCVNPWGALAGLVVSLAIGLWLGVGTMISGPEPPILPASTDGCPSETALPNQTFTDYTTMMDVSTTVHSVSSEEDVFAFYKVSQMYYALISMGICMVVAALVSAVTGLEKDVPHEQIYSCADVCCKYSCCSDDARECCRCGSLPPDDDEGDAVEVVEVHFKKTTDGPVVAGNGIHHPVRQVSYTLHSDDHVIHFLPDEILDKRQRSGTFSLHTALFHKDDNEPNTERHAEADDKRSKASSISSASSADPDAPFALGSGPSGSTSAASSPSGGKRDNVDTPSPKMDYLKVPEVIDPGYPDIWTSVGGKVPEPSGSTNGSSVKSHAEQSAETKDSSSHVETVMKEKAEVDDSSANQTLDDSNSKRSSSDKYNIRAKSGSISRNNSLSSLDNYEYPDTWLSQPSGDEGNAKQSNHVSNKDVLPATTSSGKGESREVEEGDPDLEDAKNIKIEENEQLVEADGERLTEVESPSKQYSVFINSLTDRGDDKAHEVKNGSFNMAFVDDCCTNPGVSQDVNDLAFTSTSL